MIVIIGVIEATISGHKVDGIPPEFLDNRQDIRKINEVPVILDSSEIFEPIISRHHAIPERDLLVP